MCGVFVYTYGISTIFVVMCLYILPLYTEILNRVLLNFSPAVNCYKTLENSHSCFGLQPKI